MTSPRMARMARPSGATLMAAIVASMSFGPVVPNAGATPSTSAAADAWTADDSRTGISNASASITYQGGVAGTAAASASASAGTTAGSCAMSACAILFPPPQQLCNESSGHSSFTDQITIFSDAPD